MSGARQGLLAFAGVVAALAVTAAPAVATTDRIDYSDQANPICASTHRQVLQLYESIEAEAARLDNLHPKSRKKSRQIYKRIGRLYEEFPLRYIALFRAELDQLKAIAPPPGYEGDVARWLATREELVTLYLQYTQIELQLENGPGVRRPPTRKEVKRRAKRRANLESLEEQIDQKLLTDSETDLELGAKLGAAYCVTGADGVIAVTFSDSGD